MAQHVPKLVGVMNDTKWDELWSSMYGLGSRSPAFSIRCLKSDQPSSWDREWFHHFRRDPYREIEWVDLRILHEDDRTAILACLREVHVPRKETPDGFRVFGWIPTDVFVDYL